VEKDRKGPEKLKRKDYDLAHFLSLIPYEKVRREKIELPPRSLKGAYDDTASLAGRRFVPDRCRSR
jgi:hypothetical protein